MAKYEAGARSLRPLARLDVTSDAIGRYIEALREEGYSNATVNRRTQLLGQAFNVAIRNKQISAAPFIPRLSEIGNARGLDVPALRHRQRGAEAGSAGEDAAISGDNTRRAW